MVFVTGRDRFMWPRVSSLCFSQLSILLQFKFTITMYIFTLTIFCWKDFYKLIVYLDLILLLNFIFNFMLLLLTKYLVRTAVPLYRLFLGTIVATAFIPLVIYFPNTFHSTIVKGIYSVFIILATFGFKGIGHVFKTMFMFYFISFTVGGGLFAIHFLLESSLKTNIHKILLYVNNIYGDEYSLVLLFIGFPVILYFTKSRMDRHVKDKIKYDQLYEVAITINHQVHRTTGFIDSGNHLNDPLSNRPVVICDEPFLRKFFSNEEWQMMKNAILQDKVDQFPHSIKSMIAIVPFQGVDGTSNYLYTIRPEKLTIYYHQQVIETKNVLIGIQLAKLTADERYHCLIHPEIIQLSEVRTA